MPFATNAHDESRVYFEDDGDDGTPIVILGWIPRSDRAGPGAPIARALQKLTSEFRLIYVDHRGHGRSAKPHEAKAYAMPLRVADVVAVLDRLGIERAHFVGISWGGRLCFGIGSMRRSVCGRSSSSSAAYAIDKDGPLTRVVGEALAASEVQGIEALVEAFEGIAGRYPETFAPHTSPMTPPRCAPRSARR